MKTVRVVKLDDRNFTIEVLKTRGNILQMGDNKGQPNPKAGETYWDSAEYYSHRLQPTLEAAALMGMDSGEVKEVAEAFAKACQSVEVVSR